MLSVLLALSLLHNASGKPWKASTDPWPPLQPKEVGVQTLNRQLYTVMSTGERLFDLTVSGYQFESYAHQTVVSYAAGQDSNASPAAPLMQYAQNNYATGKNLLASYAAQTCTYGEVEGGSPYPGYDFYTNYIALLSSVGVQVDFSYVTLPEHGLCLRYTAVAPWNNPALPREIVYTLTFQNSTGYLIEYDLTGTEYCCAGGYCPNEGLCNDGSEPMLTYAMTNQTLFGYQLFSNESWPKGFFDAYCPFASSSTDSSSSSSSNGSALNIGDALAILFALLFVFTAAALAVSVQRVRALQQSLMLAKSDVEMQKSEK